MPSYGYVLIVAIIIALVGVLYFLLYRRNIQKRLSGKNVKEMPAPLTVGLILAFVFTICASFISISPNKYDQPKILSVTFETFGVVDVEAISVKEGKPLHIYYQPYSEDNILLGWFYDSNYLNKYDQEKPVTENITLYAKWGVSLTTMCGSELDLEVYEIESIIEEAPHFNIEGYIFHGWYLDNFFDSIAVFPMTLAKNTTIYAKVTPITAPDLEYLYLSESDSYGVKIHSGGTYKKVEVPSSYNNKPVTDIFGTTTYLITNDIDELILPSSIVNIAQQAFFNTSIKRINSEEDNVYILPPNVKTIGSQAFSECKNVTKIVLPQTLAEISRNAFENCFNLRELNIPAKLESVGEKAFASCTSLSSLELPASVIYLGEDFAYNCRALEILTIPFCNQVFRLPLLKSVEIFGGEEIVDISFVYCPQLNRVILPDGLTSIGMSAFANNINLTNIDIPETVTEIGDGAFNACERLSRINSETEGVFNLPENLSVINNSSFNRCLGLEKLQVSSALSTINMFAFENCKNLKSISGMTGIENIFIRAFGNCINLSSINSDIGGEFIFPDTLISAESAFYNCAKVTRITMPILSSSINKSIVKSLFLYGEQGSLFDLEFVKFTKGEAINSSELEGFNKLKTVELPETITKIDSRAFSYCINLSEINIPSSVAEIGYQAFYSCRSLRTLTLPVNLSTVGFSAFADCNSMLYIKLLSKKLKNVSEGCFTEGTVILCPQENVSTLRNNNYWISNLIYDMDCIDGDYIIENNKLVKYIGNSSTIIVRSNITEIHSIAFINNSINLDYIYVDSANAAFSSQDGVLFDKSKSTLIKYPMWKKQAEYTIPASVSTISEKAFMTNVFLRKIALEGDKLFYIGNYAFRNCVSLESFNSTIKGNFIIPDSVHYLNNFVFESCYSMKSVTVGSNVLALSGAFLNCINLAEANIAETVQTVYKITFSNTALVNNAPDNSIIYAGNWAVYMKGDYQKEITIKEGTVGIATLLFNNFYGNNAALEKVILPESLKYIKSSAFADCTELKYINSEIAGDFVLPASVLEIDDSAFKNTMLENLYIKSTSLRINKNILTDCYGASVHFSAANDSEMTLLQDWNKISPMGQYAEYHFNCNH